MCHIYTDYINVSCREQEKKENMNTKNIRDLLGEYSGEKNEAKPKSTIERTIENCKSLCIEEIDTDKGTFPVDQLCKADCPFRGDG